MQFNFEGPFEGGAKVKHAAHHSAQTYDARRAGGVSVPERLGMSEGGQLARFLYVRLRHADDAVRRARWFGGRIYNNMVGGADTTYMEMPGHSLLMAMEWAGVAAPPKGVRPDRSYQLRLDVAAKRSRRCTSGVARTA